MAFRENVTERVVNVGWAGLEFTCTLSVLDRQQTLVDCFPFNAFPFVARWLAFVLSTDPPSPFHDDDLTPYARARLVGATSGTVHDLGPSSFICTGYRTTATFWNTQTRTLSGIEFATTFWPSPVSPPTSRMGWIFSYDTTADPGWSTGEAVNVTLYSA